MDKVRIGMVGLGQRGSVLLRTLLAIDAAEIVAVCDTYEDRRRAAIGVVEEKRSSTPCAYENYRELLGDPTVDLVFICSSWEVHIRQAIESMRAGKVTAVEVGGAYTLEECWELVDAYEETGTPIMMLENCCYDRFELLSTALVRRGMLGEIVHCHGAYSHDLREEILGGNVHRHYRLRNYLTRNCENYPTHELGPIARLLGVNRGNRMTRLVSMASKARGLEAFERSDKNPDRSLIGTKFAQGDIVSTMIACEGGETITLTLDTTLPKYYSREFTVRGTKGMTYQEANMVLIEGVHRDMHDTSVTSETLRKYLDNADGYASYLPDFWRNITDEARALGHGGMDYYMCSELIRCVREGRNMPIDVYDAATWAAITPLSEISIRTGEAVEIPDFTRGKYRERPLEDVVPLV